MVRAIFGFCVLNLIASSLLPAASLTPQQEDSITATIETEIDRWQLPGVMVAVQRIGEPPFIVARGTANYRSSQPLRPEMHIRIGSITKTFVTSLILLLAQNHQLSLDDPIGKCVAGVPNGNLITLRQLGNMTSGLQGYTLNPDFLLPFFTNQAIPLDELVRLGITLPPIFAPGEKWSYCNTNTVLLGRVAEIVTGRPLAAMLRERIWRPLGMRETSLPSTRAMPHPVAHGYTVQTINAQMGDATHFTPTATWAAGGAVSTVRDLLRAAPFFATGRPLLDARTQRERKKWVTLPPNGRMQSYGFGLLNFNGWIGHNGGIPGYTTIAWHLPSENLSLVISVNSDIHFGPGDAYEPAPWIASRITPIISPRNRTSPMVKTGFTRSGE